MFSRKRIVFLIAMVMVVAGALIAAFIMQLTNPPESTTSGPFTISSVSLARVGDEIVYTYKPGKLIRAWEPGSGEWISVPHSGEWEFTRFIIYWDGEKLVEKRIPFRKGENWDITFIDGREAVTIFIPNNYTFGFYVMEKFNETSPFGRMYELVKDVWMRVSFKIIEGKPQLIRLIIVYESDGNENLYIVEEGVAEKYGDVGRLVYVWNTSEWCTVAVSCAEVRDALLCDAEIRMFVEGADGNVTIAIGTEGTMTYKPSAILTFEVANRLEEPIVGVKVKVGSDEAYVALTEPIRGGEKRMVRFAPIGSFEVGGVYDVSVTAIYRGGRAHTQQLKVKCAG